MKRVTKRKYAHEIYPEGDIFDPRPLDLEVKTAYARTIGLETMETNCVDLIISGDPLKARTAWDRTEMLVLQREIAALLDAINQGLTRQAAYDYAFPIFSEESRELAWERAKANGICPEEIRPYPVMNEATYDEVKK